jgi:hypothetical protein
LSPACHPAAKVISAWPGLRDPARRAILLLIGSKEKEADLSHVVLAWDGLGENERAAILGLIEAIQ